MGCKKVNSIKKSTPRKVNGQHKKSTTAPKKVKGQSQLSVKKSTVDQRLTWQKSIVVNVLTWRYERATCVKEYARRVTAGRFFRRHLATRLAADEGDFCASESRNVKSFEWWWRCSDRRLVPKIPMKAVSLLAMYSTFDSSGTPEF